MERTYEYLQVNVFTDTKEGGNPLPVVLDATDLTDENMQNIARSFGYSETTFVLPPRDSSHTARVRIFTPRQEIPFAGHPNVGTAYVLGQQGTVVGQPIKGPMFFDELGGTIEASLIRDKKKVVGARITAPGKLHIGDEVAPTVLADCLSLRLDQIITTNHQPVFADVGLQFLFAELENLQALKAARINPEAYKQAVARYPQEDGRFSIFMYTGKDYKTLQARMCACENGKVREDAATGSACAAAGALLVQKDKRRSFSAKIQITQGVEMGSPSLIDLEVRKAKGIVDRVVVGGHCVRMESGLIGCNGQRHGSRPLL